MDALSDVLRAVRLSGAFFFDVHASAPWCAETPFGKNVVEATFPGSDHLICYHLMMEGTCWATIAPRTKPATRPSTALTSRSRSSNRCSRSVITLM